MPGMMDTVLNLGLNDTSVVTLAKTAGDERFAYDSYRRFIQMYSNVVLDVDSHNFEDILEHYKDGKGYALDTDLKADDWRAVIVDYKAKVQEATGKPFPQEPKDQLWGAIGAVFSSWMNARAITYRRLNNIPADWGTAVNVQAMVFGNMGESSATGVAFTRNPSTGENALYGEFLVNAQGEDVVAGIRTPQNITEVARKAAGSDKPSLESIMPEVFHQFVATTQLLEKHYKDMQDMEFTVERGKLWMLQTRNGKRTARAALKVAVEMANEGLISRQDAITRVEPGALNQLLHPMLDPKAKPAPIATGLPASPGAASGEIVFSADDAEAASKAGRKTILVRVETSPEDIHGMHAAEGILTTRGGMTSHAAVVARGMGKPCVSGAGAIRIDYVKETMTARRRHVEEGRHPHHRRGGRRSDAGRRADGQAGAHGRIRHADELGRRGAPHEGARQRRNAGRRAHRALVRRRGHRPLPHRAHVLRRRPDRGDARNDPGGDRGGPARGARQAVADAAAGFRGNLRDHERPAGHDPPARPAAARVPAEDRRGDRPGLQGDGRARRQAPHPFDRTARVQSDARLPRHSSGGRLSGNRRDAGAGDFPGRGRRRQEDRKAGHGGNHAAGHLRQAEFDLVKPIIVAAAEAVAKETGVTVPYQVGTMIELPRAALRAGEIAESAEFFSFGTNDLTQTTLGISRDDAGSFLGLYTSKHLLPADPFVSIDTVGVGELIKIAVERGKATRPDIKLGVCGEHGGDPASIAFCETAGLDYVSCSPFRIPIARLAAAQAALGRKAHSTA